jgi:hypothetical protein
MKLIFATMLIIFLGAAAHATPASDLELVKYCENLYSLRDKQACHDNVLKIKYISHEALVVCSELNFDSEKQLCLTNIANREFRDGIIEACSSRNFTSEKIECLNKNGTVRGSCTDNKYASELVFNSISMIDQGYTSDARQTLLNLSAYLKTCK